MGGKFDPSGSFIGWEVCREESFCEGEFLSAGKFIAKEVCVGGKFIRRNNFTRREFRRICCE